jgi:hypothetical protein
MPISFFMETIEQRKSRLAMFSQEAVKAKSDYQIEAEDVRNRTARLRAERLDREAVIHLAAPKTVVVPAAVSSVRKRTLKAKLKASKRHKAN